MLVLVSVLYSGACYLSKAFVLFLLDGFPEMKLLLIVKNRDLTKKRVKEVSN